MGWMQIPALKRESRRQTTANRRALAAAAGVVALGCHAFAQSVHTWTGSATPDTSWSNAGNWVGSGPAAPDGNDELHFAGTENLTSVNDTALNGYRIFFDSGAGAFTLSGNPFTLFDFGGNNPKIENNSSSVQTIDFAVTLDGAAAGEINPVQGNLLFNSTVTLADAGNTQLRIFGNNGHTVTFNGAISGGNSVSINQASNVIFKAANTYTGDTFVNAGTLQFQMAGSVASGFIRVGDTAADTAAATLSLTEAAGGQNIATPIVVRPSTSGTQGIRTIKSTNTSNTNTYSGNIFLDADVTVSSDNAGGVLALTGTTIDLKNQTMTVTGAGDTNISGQLTDSTGAGKILKTGNGLLTLVNGNTHSGSITINSGTASIGADSALGTVSGDNAVTFTGGALRATSSFTLASTRNPQFNTGGGTYDVASGATLTVAGVQKGIGGYNKTGAGVLVLTNGASTVTGPISVTGGVLQIGTSGMIGGTGAGAGNVTINAGALRNSDSSTSGVLLTANRAIIAGSGGATLELSNSAAILRYLGNLSGTGNTVTKTGPGTLRVSDTSVSPAVHLVTSFEKLVVRGGLWQGAIDSVFGAVPVSPHADAITLDGGGIGFNGGAVLVANRGVTLGTAGGTINASSSGTISGVISGVVGGGLTKTGVNAVSLTSTNSYDGPTTILAGRINTNANGALGTGVVSFPVVATGVGTLVNTTSPVSDVTLNNEFQLNSTFTIDISSNSGRTLELAGKVTGASNWRKDNSPSSGGTGTVVLSNSANDFAGGLTVAVGQLAITANNALGSTAGATTINSGASLVLRGGFDYTAAEPLSIGGNGSAASNGAINNPSAVNSFAGPITMTAASRVNVAADRLTLSGAITDGASAFALDKAGVGTLRLTNDNTYDGATTISNGILLASNTTGSATGTGNITVNAGGTLGGTGAVSGSVTVNAGGSLAPGESVETIDTGPLNFADATAAYRIEIDADTPAADRTNVTGAVSLGGAGVNISFVAITAGSHSTPQTFVVINNDDSDAVAGTFGTITAPDWAQVVVDYAYGGTDSANFMADGNDVAITVTYVPEPAGAAVFAVLPLIARRRRI